MTPRTRQRVAGFTLLEIIVAVAIFGIVSAVAYSGLNAVLNTQSETRQHAERLNALQRALTLIETDFEQAAPRSVRDRYGDRQPALQGNVDGVNLTRAGHLNPMGQPRSAFQRIGYRLNEDGQLVRRTWTGLDQPIDPSPHDAVLLDHVDAFSVTYTTGPDSDWVEQWPPTGAQIPNQVLPLAVKVTLKLPEYKGEIVRILRIPGS